MRDSTVELEMMSVSAGSLGRAEKATGQASRGNRSCPGLSADEEASRSASSFRTDQPGQALRAVQPRSCGLGQTNVADEACWPWRNSRDLRQVGAIRWLQACFL